MRNTDLRISGIIKQDELDKEIRPMNIVPKHFKYT